MNEGPAVRYYDKLLLRKSVFTAVISDGIRVRVKCNSGLLARVGPGHCCYRIGLIHLLAGWHKRRPEPGLVWFHLV